MRQSAASNLIDVRFTSESWHRLSDSEIPLPESEDTIG
jgi:hypothetical protein